MMSKLQITFLGTGVSHALPMIPCLLKETPDCKVCLKGAGLFSPSGPEDRKNKRNNVSLLVQHAVGDGPTKSILIDAGKTFRNAALQFFKESGVRTVDSVLITHEHMDAMGGLDDLRSFTMATKQPINVYIRPFDFETVKRQYPYFLTASGGKAPNGLDVADVRFNLIDEVTPFVVEGMEVTPLRVWHGKEYSTLGYRFGPNPGGVVYLSDVSEIPEELYPKLHHADILVLDLLHRKKHWSHFCLSESLEATQRIRPKRVFFVGMSHDIDHQETNAELAQWSQEQDWPVEAQLAFDGLSLPICCEPMF